MAYTTIDDPSEYFQAQTYTGNNSDGLAITNSGNSNLQPDWLWIKKRSGSGQHVLVDSTRGANKQLFTSLSDTEQTSTEFVASLDTDGFTLNDNSSGTGDTNATNGGTYVAWNWKANGGTTSTNNDGSITSTVQANTTAGFSILTYSANATAGATVGHGLGTTPSVVILKKRSGTGDGNWLVGHKNFVGNSAENLIFDSNGAVASADDAAGSTWNRTAFTSTVFTLGDGQAGDYTGRTNRSGYSMLAYCFAEIKGYSKFGSYTGNGVSNNGTFAYTGFLPSWVMIRRTDSGASWLIFDNKRGATNMVSQRLYANDAQGEDTGTADGMDFVSNGFKIRSSTGSSSSSNASGATYIYMAFAEHPFVSSKGVPVTAR